MNSRARPSIPQGERFLIEAGKLFLRTPLRRVCVPCQEQPHALLWGNKDHADQLQLDHEIHSPMGHSSINVTMDTYGHLMKTVNKESAKRLDMTIFKQTGDF